LYKVYLITGIHYTWILVCLSIYNIVKPGRERERVGCMIYEIVLHATNSVSCHRSVL